MIEAADRARIESAHRRLRERLLAARRPEGFWLGELSSSALATATAVSALAAAGREENAALVERGAGWLAAHQNEDGGWGDTTDSPSNLAATMLVRAALGIAGAGDSATDTIARAESWLTSRAGATAGERAAALAAWYGEDRTFAVPILMNCALAGLVEWRDIPRLPFELARFSHRWLRIMRIHVVSYALPALVAIGQLLHARHPTRNPILKLLRDRSIEPTLERLAAIQPSTGGFIEAVPLTSFVVMSLAAAGRAGHEVTRRGVEFLRGAAREDGSWPVDSNLSMWVTTNAVAALGTDGDIRTVGQAGRGTSSGINPSPGPSGHPLPREGGETTTTEWILTGQHRTDHAYTGAAPGGWAWTHLAGGVPDADDTAGALVALAMSSGLNPSPGPDGPPSPKGEWLEAAAREGVRWLLGLQNDDGGWPAFCRGWGKLPFDRSAADLTAHAARALAAWGPRIGGGEIPLAVERAFGYLQMVQEPDGSWQPLWFGNQAAPGQRNPVIGTGRVLAAYRDLGRTGDPAAERGVAYLLAAQNGDGGWGGAKGVASTIEETALAVDGLSEWMERAEVERACVRGSLWLVEQASGDAIDRPSPLGLYFTTLWYGERLYPLIWTVAALGRTVARRIHATSGANAS